MSTYRVAHRGFFPQNVYFRLFLDFFFLKSDFQAHCFLTFINRVKCYILLQEICGCDSSSAFITLPSAAWTPLFMFLAKTNAKKDQCKISLETYFRIAENAVVLCKNFKHCFCIRSNNHKFLPPFHQRQKRVENETKTAHNSWAVST